MRELHKPTIAILASGSGTTAEAVIHATQDGRLDAEVGLIISDVAYAGVFDKVKRLNKQHGLDIAGAAFPRDIFRKGSEGRGITREQSELMAARITEEGIGHVSLMGFMQVVRFDLLDEFGWTPGDPLEKGNMDNTHPSILPQTADTYGPHASQRVLDLGLEFSAHTYHLIAGGVDTGAVLCSTPVKVEPGDTKEELFARVQVVEKAVLPLAVDKFLKQKAAFLGNS